jgi:tRNA threonylcarbamoyladenosine biosynthesis protein TsaE
MKFVSKSLKETREIAEKLLATIDRTSEHAAVIALQGDLGSGKTTLSQKIGEILEVKDNMHSPTFVIEKIYDIDWRGFRKLIHIDAYRLEKESELEHLGWNDITKNGENIILIEWPENVKGIIPEFAKRVNLRFLDDITREIEFE